MKVCGTCGKIFGDEMLFCLDDGTILREQTASFAKTMSEEQTVIKPAPKAAGSSKMIFAALGGFLILGFVLITAAIGGIVYYSALSEENVGSQQPTPMPEPIDQYYPTPTSADNPIETPTPEKDRTPKPEHTAKPTPIPETAEDQPHDQELRDEDASLKDIPKIISGGVLNGKATYLPRPAYSEAISRRLRVARSIAVQVVLDERGNVVSASAMNGHPALRAAAVNAARQAKFSPTRLSGKPVKVRGVINYNFTP